jgi:hypothetical protein
MSGAIPPLPLYSFMAWCLVTYRHNFTFYLYTKCFRVILMLRLLRFILRVTLLQGAVLTLTHAILIGWQISIKMTQFLNNISITMWFTLTYFKSKFTYLTEILGLSLGQNWWNFIHVAPIIWVLLKFVSFTVINFKGQIAIGWMTEVRFPAESEEFLSPPPRPDRFWGPRSLPSNRHRGLLHRG